jgi:hypothetical protein
MFGDHPPRAHVQYHLASIVPPQPTLAEINSAASLFDRPSLSCASLTYVSGWWSGACKTLKPVKGISAREKKAFNSRVNEIYEYWSERESRWDELQDDSEMEELQGHSQAERSEVEVIV